MNHFELAKQRLDTWINADPQRVKNFLDISKGLTVQEFCDKHAHRPDIIKNIVLDNMILQAAVITQQINGG